MAKICPNCNFNFLKINHLLQVFIFLFQMFELSRVGNVHWREVDKELFS